MRKMILIVGFCLLFMPTQQVSAAASQPATDFGHYQALYQEQYDWLNAERTKMSNDPTYLKLLEESPGHYLQAIGPAQSYQPEEVTLIDMTDADFTLAVNRKLAMLPDGFELTSDLSEVQFYFVNEHDRPTRSEPHKVTSYKDEYDSANYLYCVTLTEHYTVQPGDTLGEIILKNGWLPKWHNLYGGYINYLANQMELRDQNKIYPGDILTWESEEIFLINNLYPNMIVQAPLEALSNR